MNTQTTNKETTVTVSIPSDLPLVAIPPVMTTEQRLADILKAVRASDPSLKGKEERLATLKKSARAVSRSLNTLKTLANIGKEIEKAEAKQAAIESKAAPLIMSFEAAMKQAATLK